MRRDPARRRLTCALIACAFAVVQMLPAAAAPEQRAFLDLTVNTVPQGQALVVLRDSDILVRESDLERAGLHGYDGTRVRIGGDEFVSLASLAPGITFSFDEERLSLAITARPQFLGTTDLALRSGGPTGAVDRRSSGFLNYALTSDLASGYTGFFETGVTAGGRLFYSSFSRDATGAFVRGLTNMVEDDRTRMRRTVIGDTLSDAGDLGGTARIAGIGVSREWELSPTFIRYATPGLSGTVLTPSTVDVYVNGRLFSEQQLPPGAFNLRDIPVTAGSSVTRIVIRDAFGREQTITSPFYLSTEMLRRGLTDYSYNVGFKSATPFGGTTSPSYGPLSFLGRYQLGVTDHFNVGGRLEMGGGLASGGPLVAFDGPFGQISASAAVSTSSGVRGSAASLAYGYSSPHVSFGASAVLQSRTYANSSIALGDDRALLDGSVFVGFPLGTRASLSLRYASTNWRDAGHQGGFTVNGDLRLTKRTSLFVIASRGRTAAATTTLGTPLTPLGPTTTLYVGLIQLFGVRDSATVAFSKDQNGAGVSTDLEHPAPAGPGFGYRLLDSGGATGGFHGSARFQTVYGDAEVRRDEFAGSGTTSVTLAGGLAAIGGHVLPSRPILDSFALVDVGAPNVRTYLNSQEVGRTDRKGQILVPGLLPFLDNQLSIAPEDTPIDYTVDATRRDVSPGFRGGSLVRFPAQRYRAYTGTIVVDTASASIVPSYGVLRVALPAPRSTVESDLGERGEFYLEKIDPGTYEAEVTAQNASCRFRLRVPDSNAPIMKLGTLRCASAESR